MAVAFRSAGTLGTSGFGTPTVNYPTGVASGDLLVIQYTCATNVTPTTPSGWTKLFGPTALGSGSSMNAFVYYKTAGGSEPSSITFANSGSNNAAAGIMVAYTGADPTTPINTSATAGNATSGTTGTTPSVTTTVANTVLLRMYWNYSNTATIAPAGTDTERYDVFYGTPFVGLEMADSTQAAAGASGTTTATFSTATSGGLTGTIAVAPAVAGAPPVADFTGTPTSGAASLSVTFTDSSTNTPTSWAWTFGDGGTSSSQNPSHSYTTSGVYTVALVATNAGGSDTKTRTGYITVTEAIVYAAGGGIEVW